MSQTKEKLLLIDGNSVLYRAFFALPLLSNAEGQHTNAVYGFTMMLLKLLQEERPTHAAVAFDSGKATFRHQLYPAYKGTREKTPDELSEQFPLVREVLRAMGIAVLEREGYEADDLIGTVCRQAEEDGIDVLVVSGDKDLLQLVSPSVTAVLTRKGITETDRYDPEAVRARFGLEPAQIVDLKGLMGDSSDNIPGVPGVGEKTAAKLLQEHGSLEGVYDHLDAISGSKLRERLLANREQALMSKRLAEIRRDVPVNASWRDLQWTPGSREAVRRIFQQLAFRSLLDKIPPVFSEEGDGEGDARPLDGAGDPGGSRAGAALPQAEIRPWSDWSAEQWAGECGLFLDLDGHYQFGHLRGVALSDGERAWYLPCPAGEAGWREGLGRLLERTGRPVLYDLKAWAVAAAELGLPGPTGAFDVLLAAYLANPSDGHPELSAVIKQHLGIELPPVAGRGAPGGEERARLCAMYAAAMVKVRPRLERALAEAGLCSLYLDLELPLSLVLARMERSGVRVDAARLRSIGEEFSADLDRLEKEIYAIAGVSFNLNSPKQLAEILFDKLGLPPLKKTKTGYSTGADVLEKLAPYHEIVGKILDYRQLMKLQSTYVEGLLKMIRPETGKIHTCFQQAVTATGRLSSTDPNLQNIPVRMEQGRRLRQAFIPSEAGWKILSADYSQIELRVLAHFSKDPGLMQAFREDLDIHARTAAEVFEVPLDRVTPQMRRQAKAVNFGIVYGISDYGLSQNLGIPRKEAAQFIERYFSKFPRVKSFMEEMVERARRDGYVTTLLGRRRYVPDIRAANYNARAFAERTAMNTPIQGSAADIIKRAMVDVDHRMRRNGYRARMLLQVHDELVFEVPEDEVEALTALVRESMESAVPLEVPLKVDIHVGDNWYEAK
ncbi:MAG: DNA polymerase I [Alicyclobacillaceae bacterium]|nr:DNA polymerase I [Alicyclobacillaceae bacterium]